MARNCAGGAFVTFLSGDSYVPGALCLWAQMHRLKSRCALLLVYDDRDGFGLSAGSLQRIRATFGPGRVLKLSSLFARMGGARTAVYGHRNFTAIRRKPMRFSFEGRRLLPRSSGMGLHADVTSWLKLWLWAIPPSRYSQLVRFAALLAGARSRFC